MILEIVNIAKRAKMNL